MKTRLIVLLFTFIPVFVAFSSKSASSTSINPSTILVTGWYEVIETENNFKRELEDSEESYYLNPQPIVTAKDIASTEVYESNFGDVGLLIQLNEKGTDLWSRGTAATIGKQVAFVLNNRLLYVATVNQQINNGISAINNGAYTKQQLENFATLIESER